MSLSGWAIMAALAILLVAEVVQAIRHRELISVVVWRASGRYPVIPFATGFACGHFFWAPASTYIVSVIVRK